MKFPEDFQEDAGTHFKIGNIVTIYKSKMDKDRLGVVRFLPIKVKGQPYFNNDYGVTSIYDNGIETYAIDEREIQLFNGKLEEDSDIKILQQIITEDIKVSKETWKQTLKRYDYIVDLCDKFDNLVNK